MLYGFTYLKQGWTFFIILATCGVVDVSMLVGRTLHGQKIHKTSVDDGKNRYSWRLTDSPPFSQGFENVYLDSPASAPSVFGPEARLYCLPVLEDNWNLTCLLVQAIDGKHGAQYKRVGLTKVLKIYPDVSDIKEPPGNNENTFGRYYWGPDGKVGGESTICII